MSEYEFHAILTPGILGRRKRGRPRDPMRLDETLTISFDKPRRADNVLIGLFEADEWAEGTTHVEEGGGGFDLIALFKGDIREGKFIGLPRLQGRGAGPKARKLRVHIDGDPADKVYTLEISEDTGEQEGGLLEIVLCVSGIINGVEKKYEIRTPVFARSAPDDRPVITFITGRDGFFASASAYWKPLTDGVIPPPPNRKFSFEEILNYLRQPIRKGKHVFNPPWGEVNIVAHGTNYGRRKDGNNCDFCEIFIPLFRGDDNDPERRSTRAGLLKRYSGNPQLIAPDEKILDEDSIIVIRGCMIGEDQVLLDELRRLFGWRATVIAPRPVQWYHGQAGQVKENLLEYFFFYTPGTARPNQRDCIRGLSNKYRGRNTDEQWTQMLNNNFRHDRPENGWIRFRVEYPSQPPADHDFDRDARNTFAQEYKKDAERMYFSDFDDWAWQRQGPDPTQNGRVTYRFIGSRYRVDARRVLNDSKGRPVVPEITDPIYYGRSPALTAIK